MPTPKVWRTAAVLTTTSALAISAAAALTSSADAAASPRAVANSKPTWTAHAQHLGAANDSTPVNARVYLAPKGGLAALRATATALSTPGSSSYHHFLTAAQYRARFAPTNASVQSVRSWLTGSGLTVTGVGAQNRFVAVRGTVRQAEKAFGTSIQRYRHSNQNVQAPDSSVKVPAALASSVLAVGGLDTTTARVKTQTSAQVAPPAGFRNARPCSLYYGQLDAKYLADNKTPLPKFNGSTLPYAPCGYTGPQFRGAYESDTDLTGSGVTVGVIDAYTSSTIAKDANTYATNHGDGSYLPGQYTETVSRPFRFTGTNPKTGCDAPGWTGEQTLDIEAVHAMAPEATIHYYGARSCHDDDILDIQAQLVQQDAVQIVSNSYGEAESDVNTDLTAASEQVFLQGATEGITFAFSSGDNGDELLNTGIKQADSSASSPSVTAVGGTSNRPG